MQGAVQRAEAGVAGRKHMGAPRQYQHDQALYVTRVHAHVSHACVLGASSCMPPATPSARQPSTLYPLQCTHQSCTCRCDPAVIGRETRRQCQEKWGGKPDIVMACVGGGSNAIGIFNEFVDDQDVSGPLGARCTGPCLLVTCCMDAGRSTSCMQAAGHALATRCWSHAA